MLTSAKAWEKEFVKLFFMLGSETKFIAQQVSALTIRDSAQWFKKKDWMGDCTLSKIIPPLPLPAIPHAAIFGLSHEEYRAKILDWMSTRDGKAPSADFYEKTFTEYGQEPNYPQTTPSSSRKKPKGKAAETVNLDD